MSKSVEFELSRDIEHYLSVLSKLCMQDGKKEKLEIIVNSQIRISEAWSSDNWNGGTYGHALFFVVPEALYLRALKRRDHLQNEIRNDLNSVHNVPNEYIETVFIEVERTADKDWRKETGVLDRGQRYIPDQAQSRIWGEQDFLRLFLSHKVEFKTRTATLKKHLQLFGVSCFVAHEDIHPTKEWQNEIENALFSMDAFCALMTKDFHDSLWTDQEVGVAFGRGVPIVALRLGQDPYGFIGKFQAVSCSWDEAPFEIVKVLIKHPSMVTAFIKNLKNCTGYDDGNTLATVLPFIENLSEQQVSDLINCYNDNSQLRGSYGFNGSKPSRYGDGLVYHLNKLTGRKYSMDRDSRIED